MWIAKDKDGVIRMFKTKPYKQVGFNGDEYWHSNDETIIEVPTDWDLGVAINWEDDPIEMFITPVSISNIANDLTDAICGYFLGRPEGKEMGDILVTMKRLNQALNKVK